MLTNESVIKSGKPWLIGVLVAMLVLALISIAVVITTLATRIEPHIYIALGDSISSGYGLDGYDEAPEGKHPTVFFEMLENAGYADEYHNMAQSGFTTTDLLTQLEEMSEEQLLLFREARVITLNIGGNNLLLPFLSYLSYTHEVSGFEDILAELGGLIGRLFGGASGNDSNTLDVFSILMGNLSPELQSMLENGVDAFSYEFAEIILLLNDNAPNATVIVNTIFNPIPQELLGIYLPISSVAETLIDSMNAVITENSEVLGYFVSDIHASLSNRAELFEFNINPFVGPLSFDPVHPNEKGHYLIAELNYATFRETVD